MNSTYPKTLDDLFARGTKWSPNLKKGRYVLSYKLPNQLQEVSRLYSVDDLRKIDPLLPDVMHALLRCTYRIHLPDIQNTLALHTARHQLFDYDDTPQYWITWTSLRLTRSGNVEIEMPLYRLHDKSTQQLPLAREGSAWRRFIFTVDHVERLFPGVMTAINLATQLELSREHAAKFCLAHLGLDNPLYPTPTALPVLPTLLIEP